MPVVSPLSADDKGQLLNINADTVAAAIGAALGAEKLILCTGAPGILERVDDPRSLISYTDLDGPAASCARSGAIKDGMLPKVEAIEEAIRGGVRRVHVISYDAPDSLLAEVFTNEGTGTLIVSRHQGAERRRAAGRQGLMTPPLGQGRAARRAGAALHRRRGPRARRAAGALRRARLDRACRDAARRGTARRRTTCDAIAKGLHEIGAAHAAASGRSARPIEDGQTALEKPAHRADRRRRRPRASRPLAQRPGAHRAAAVPEGCRRRARRRRSTRRRGARALADEQGSIALPGYTHMQQAHAELRALWARRLRQPSCATTRRACAPRMRRIDKNPLGSAAGYGAPSLPLDREAHARGAGLRAACRSP